MSNCLVGKTITGVKMATDKEAMLFETTEGSIVCKVDGDCCSHSWIEHVELPALGFPCVVVSMGDLDMNKPAQEIDYDHIQFYGYKLITDRGEIIIDYRNSSNGYYGGNIHWPDDDYYYGGVFGQNVSKEEWQDIQP